MKIQGRLTLGIGVLFAMILLLGIQSVSYVRQLSRATGTILADNYNSLQYAGDMLRSLNDIGQDSVSRHALRQSLAGCLVCSALTLTVIDAARIAARLIRGMASLPALLGVAGPEILWSMAFVFPIYFFYRWVFLRVPKRTVL